MSLSNHPERILAMKKFSVAVCECGDSLAEHGYSKVLPCTVLGCTCPCFRRSPADRMGSEEITSQTP